MRDSKERVGAGGSTGGRSNSAIKANNHRVKMKKAA